MNDDIIRMAREADPDWDYDRDVVEWLARFAALVRADEREACAKVCDFEVARLTAIDEPRPALAVGICAASIRARGQI